MKDRFSPGFDFPMSAERDCDASAKETARNGFGQAAPDIAADDPRIEAVARRMWESDKADFFNDDSTRGSYVTYESQRKRMRRRAVVAMAALEETWCHECRDKLAQFKEPCGECGRSLAPEAEGGRP